jgi:SAM-dependent methyltransferase
VLVASKLANYAFDMRYGVETQQEVDRGSLTDTIGDITHAEPYGALQVLDLRKLFRTLDLGPDRVLVDLGSGKGRILRVASAFGFRAARGVEFSGGLCDVARRNMQQFRARSGTRTEFEIIHADAGDYPIRDDEDVFFLANPFDEHVLRRVMANITRSFVAKPRHLMLIYFMPAHFSPVREACVTDDTPFSRTATHVVRGRTFAIFEARP